MARVTYVDATGAPAVRFFANIAEVGLGGSTARWASAMPAALGPSRYFFAFRATLPCYRPGPMSIEVDGVVAYEGRTANVVSPTAVTSGAGCTSRPRSDPADGVLELLAFTGPKTDSFTMLPRFYRGRHLPHPGSSKRPVVASAWTRRSPSNWRRTARCWARRPSPSRWCPEPWISRHERGGTDPTP